MKRYGKCTNHDKHCSAAKTGEIIAKEDTQAFVCPCCQRPLFEVSISKPRASGEAKPVVMILGLLFLTGSVLGVLFWTGIKDKEETFQKEIVNKKPSRIQGSKESQPPIKAVKTESPEVAAIPTKGTKIKGSEYCLDCESFYKVADGRGGTFTETEGYNTRCCKCGSKVAFKDGYYYDIVCEDDRIKAVMAGKVE